MGKQIDEWMDRWTYGQTNRQTDERTDGWMDIQKYRWLDRQADGQSEQLGMQNICLLNTQKVLDQSVILYVLSFITFLTQNDLFMFIYLEAAVCFPTTFVYHFVYILILFLYLETSIEELLLKIVNKSLFLKSELIAT